MTDAFREKINALVEAIINKDSDLIYDKGISKALEALGYEITHRIEYKGLCLDKWAIRLPLPVEL